MDISLFLCKITCPTYLYLYEYYNIYTNMNNIYDKIRSLINEHIPNNFYKEIIAF